MANYSTSYYMDDHGAYNRDYPFPFYYNNFDSASVQDSACYSSYTSNGYQIFSSDSIPFFSAYDHPVPSFSRIGYSVSGYSEPKYIEYKPAPHYIAQTQFIISYSVSEFDDTNFEECDPTPYGGGYDQSLTYGKPLPPSDETCYPRSTSLNGVSPGVITTPVVTEVVDEHAAKPQAGSKPTAAIAEAEQQELQLDKPLDLYQGEESKEKYGDDHNSWSGYDNGLRGESGYEYEKQVAQIPSGYGLEAMDLCEGLFGYWPCLSRYRKRYSDCQEAAADCGNYRWKGTADYLFGSPDPYGDRRDDDYGGSYGNVIYGYQRHYQQQQQLLYHQVDDSWSA
ncbi:uncharacterized protein LOC8267431 [Ricinus communis]|uniref:uncharacterized protein LOC8267431 n=1 Tax=Ricinus communis TaxID=3988 RepID=UPI00201AFC81|nr:uncharacterized protein LOC8267431 [Ricinus communis]